MAQIFDWPLRIVHSTAHKSVPDGALLNPETLEVVPVKNFIKISDQVVIDPVSFGALPIGQLFFNDVAEAKTYLVQAYQKQISSLQAAITKLEKELEL